MSNREEVKFPASGNGLSTDLIARPGDKPGVWTLHSDQGEVGELEVLKDEEAYSWSGDESISDDSLAEIGDVLYALEYGEVVEVG